MDRHDQIGSCTMLPLTTIQEDIDEIDNNSIEHVILKTGKKRFLHKINFYLFDYVLQCHRNS